MILGELDTAIERAISLALIPAEELNRSIVAAVAKGASLKGAKGRVERAKWPSEIDYATVAKEATMIACIYGHLEVWMDAKGITEFQEASWVKLPFQEAIEAFKARTPILTPRAFNALTDAAKSKAWTIAGHHDRYTRQSIKSSLEQALEEGWSQQQWINEAEGIFARAGVSSKGTHHLSTVYETNMSGAYNNGRWRQQNTPAITHRRPLLRYITMGDDRVRDSHAAMSGFVARRDHPAWRTWYPPNGFRCRCMVEAIRDDGTAVSNRKRAPGGKPDEGFATSPDDFWGAKIPPPRQRAGPSPKRTAREAREARARQRVAP
jgi:SPP1 gp7 family putative phage head morphogenesis protein